MHEDTISDYSWKIALLGAALLLSMGVIVFISLALGFANPPYAGELQWQSQDLSTWNRLSDHQFEAPITPTTDHWTLEAKASLADVWGLWLKNADQTRYFLTDGVAYVSISEDEQPSWAAFIHVRPEGENTLYLHHADGQITFRVNEEIAWQGASISPMTWGLLYPIETANPPITVRLYHP